MMKKRIAYIFDTAQQARFHEDALFALRRLNANYNPINYRLAYEYAVNQNDGLNESINFLLATNQPLTDMTAIRLTQEHLDMHHMIDEQDNIAFHQVVVNAISDINKKLEDQAELINDEELLTNDPRTHVKKLTRSNSLLTRKAKSTLTNIIALQAKSMGNKETIYTDLVTGLKNQFHLQIMMPEILRRQKPDSFMYIALFDVDNFTEFNNTHGVHLGDSLLRTVAKVLDLFRTHHNGYTWRSGPDEFVIVVNANDAQNLINLLNAALQKINSLSFKDKEGAHVHASMSLTVASSDFTESINRAYKALMPVKNTSGANIHV